MATEWYRNHPEYREILEAPQNAGFGVWKPLVFYEALRAHEGDGFVMWHDAGLVRNRYWELFNSPLPLEEFAEKIQTEYGGLYAVPSTYVQDQWTKRRCLEELNGITPANLVLHQFCAHFIFAQAASTPIAFAAEWLHYSPKGSGGQHAAPPGRSSQFSGTPV